MHRFNTMAFGFFLIFLGIQLNVVERYVMTPRTANFMSADGDLRSAFQQPVGSNGIVNPANNSPYYQASYQAPNAAIAPAYSTSPISREIRPPRWLCWPVLFLGAVILLNGLAVRRD